MDQNERQQAELLNKRGIQVSTSVTVQRDAEDLYRVWRDLKDLSRFIDILVHVHVIDDLHSRWIVRGPIGTKYVWTAEIIRDVPNQHISWRTEPTSDVVSAGTIHFQQLPFDRGTEVKVVLDFVPPGGLLGSALGKQLAQDVRAQVQMALFRLRQVMEAGEVAVSKGQPVGANPFRDDRPDGADRRVSDADLSDVATKGRP